MDVDKLVSAEWPNSVSVTCLYSYPSVCGFAMNTVEGIHEMVLSHDNFQLLFTFQTMEKGEVSNQRKKTGVIF